MVTTTDIYEEISQKDFYEILTNIQSGALKAADFIGFDLRSFFVFGFSHSILAINVSIPRALTGKKPVSAERLRSLITGVSGKEEFDLRQDRTIIIYDEIQPVKGKRPANALAQFLKDEGIVGNVYILAEGFNKFKKTYPDICEFKEEQNLSNDFSTETPSIVTESSKGSDFKFVGSSDYNPPSEVIPGRLYIGNDRNASNIDTLKNIGIKRVLNLAKECSNHHANSDNYKIIYKKIELDDDPNQDIVPYIKEALTFIHDGVKAGDAVFVHCYQGISRSSTIIIMYLMKYMGLSFNDAYDYIKKCRPKVCPNTGFISHLIDLERRLYDGNTSIVGDEYAPFIMNPMDQNYLTISPTIRVQELDLRQFD